MTTETTQARIEGTPDPKVEKRYYSRSSASEYRGADYCVGGLRP